jgi:hypothetical protein
MKERLEALEAKIEAFVGKANEILDGLDAEAAAIASAPGTHLAGFPPLATARKEAVVAEVDAFIAELDALLE